MPKSLAAVLSCLIALSTTVTSTPVGASTQRLVSPAIFAKVMKVHHCEEPRTWHASGPLYFGGLGWRAATWSAFRAPSFPRNMALATPEQQAWSMLRFVIKANGGYWPDQSWPAFCGSGY